MLLPSAAGSASAVSVFPESTASGEESGEDTSPATDHSGMKQQPEVLLCEGSHHITPLDVLLCEGSHHITPLDVLLCEGSHHITPLDVLLCGKSHHITPLPLTTVNKKCISEAFTEGQAHHETHGNKVHHLADEDKIVTKGRVACGATYLCESGFSTLLQIKNKSWSQLDVDPDMRCALSVTQPQIGQLAENKQYQPSH
ncbi:hypothetical protein O3P69_013657 [Scylla paramamosain]|uniref:Uncharacterized protein n=1 Tax=Scylla paramamosain TaxID=85552 RepID=A0AAW0SPW1_SCYPA